MIFAPSLGEHLSRIERNAAGSFRPFDVSLSLSDDKSRVMFKVGDRSYEGERPSGDAAFKEIFLGLVEAAAADLKADGWEPGANGHWVDPATVDFMRNEPHPVVL
jgi:hypothetical protein